MNPFDMLAAVILGYCIIRGIFRGLIREAASIIGMVAGFYLSYSNYKSLSPILARWMPNFAYLDIASFIILFCAVLMIVTGLGILIRLILKFALLGMFDRILGALFGALKGALIVSLLFMLLISFLPPGGVAMVSKSRFSPYVNAVSKGIALVIPETMKNSFTNNINELKKEWGKKSS